MWPARPLKGTQVLLQENVVKQTRVGVSAPRTYLRLENSVRVI